MAVANLEYGYRTIQKLAEALGLSDKRIVSITLRAHVKEIARITVEMHAEVPGIDGACMVLREYRLEPIPQTDSFGVTGECLIKEVSPVKFREYT